MKIAFFNRSFWPDVEATGQLLTELCEDLAERHEVTVVAGRSYHAGERILARPVRQEEIRTGRGLIRILRVGNTVFDKRRLIKRGINLATYFAGAFLAGFMLKKPDVIVAETDPPIAGLLGVFFKYWHRCRFVYYCQDLHPDVGLATGRLTNPLVVFALRQANAVILRHADRVVALGEDMKRRLIAKGVSERLIDVVPNWTDSRAVRAESGASRFRARHGLDGHFLVMYSGNLGLSQGLDKVIETAALLRDQEDVRFLFIGKGADEGRLRRLVEVQGLGSVSFLPYQPKEALSETLGAADVHLVPLQRGVAGCIVPSKVYGIMAAGRPFIASMEPDAEAARIAGKHGCGMVIPPEDPVALAEAIRWCRSHPNELACMGANARAALLAHYDRPIATRRFERAALGNHRASLRAVESGL